MLQPSPEAISYYIGNVFIDVSPVVLKISKMIKKTNPPHLIPLCPQKLIPNDM